MRRCALMACAAALALVTGLCGVPSGVSGRGTVLTAQAQGSTSEKKKEIPGEEEVSELLDFIKEKWDAGEFDSREDIEAAIAEGEEKFGVSLDDGKREQLAQALEKLDELGLDHDAAVDLAKNLYRDYGDEIVENLQSLYDQYGDELVDNAETILKEQLTGPLGDAVREELAEPLKKAVKEQVVEPAKEAAKNAVKSTAKRFWSDLKDSVGSFFRNIFS